MKKIILLAAWMIALPAMAQNVNKNNSQLATYITNSGSFLTANKLSSTQMKKMLQDTFADKKDDADFKKALEKYMSSQYNKDLVSTLSTYYNKQLTSEQIDQLVNGANTEGVKRATEGIAKCEDATYRDMMVDETLTSVAQKTGKKKKKKNLKKFKSDCTEDYRTAITAYTQATGSGKLAEDKVNALYHTVSISDLNEYTAYMNSDAVASGKKAEAAVKDDIYTVQAACVSNFQTWTYKNYPSLFTKKQTVSKKRKVKRGKKGTAAVKNDADVTIDGGILH